MRTLIVSIFFLWTTELLAQVNAPISAIDWLSQPGLAPLSEDNLIKNDPSIGAILDEVTVIELDSSGNKSYGLIPAKISGIPPNFWIDIDPNTLKQIIGSLAKSGLPATNDLLLRALLAETIGGEAVLRARVQALIDRGAVHAAYSLLSQAPINNLESFSLLSEASLLTDNVEQMCRQLNSARHLSNDEGLQVYCHARAGSWDTAVLNYFTLNTLGAFTPTTSALLAADLDPELASHLVLFPVDAAKLTALEFKLRASVGQPVSTRTLPLKFAPSDLTVSHSWQQQIKAAERLSALGSLPAIQLLQKYKLAKSSDSSLVWDRIVAVQELDLALADPIIDSSEELLIFWELMKDRKLLFAFARAWAEKLEKFDKASHEDEYLFQMQVLSRANAFEFKSTMARLRSYNPKVLAMTYERIMFLLDQNIIEKIPFQSANMLRGMRLISEALDGNEGAILEAISLFQSMGLTPLAKQLAMEFIILGPER